jgi:hypothetical protein
MSWALRMNNSSKDQAYLGWYGEPTSNEPNAPEHAYQKWTRNEWERLGEGDNILEALIYAIGQQTQAGPKDPMNNFRVKGQGFVDDIFLSND